MAALATLVGLVLAQASPATTMTVEGAHQDRGGPDWVDVGFAELATGRPAAAIARIRDNGALDVDDPAALINLGSAHARVGQRQRAERFYKAAIISSTRYDLQLSDGRWMDSRSAAREAIAALQHGSVLALR